MDYDEVKKTGTPVYVAIGDKYAGYILIADQVKEDAKPTLQYLQERCRAVLVMLTGDTEGASKEVAKEMKMDYAYTNLMPEDKLEQLEDFMGCRTAERSWYVSATVSTTLRCWQERM